MPTRRENGFSLTRARRLALGAAAWRLPVLLAVLWPVFQPVVLAGGAGVSEQYLQQPIHFEPNHGLAGPDTRFVSRAPGLTILLQERQAMLLLEHLPEDTRTGRGKGVATKNRRAVVRIRFPGAKIPEAITAEGPLAGVSNYFLGGDSERWRTGVPHYRAVRYEGIHQGVDLVFHGNERQIEYDFVLAPGVDAGVAGFALDGAARLELDDVGDLVVHTAAGKLLLRRPVAYQEIEGNRIEVACRYRLAGDRIGFDLGEYDRRRTLVIDPLLYFSTYLGGAGYDVANGIARDNDGNVYIAGQTASAGFVTSPGAWQEGYGGDGDAFVTKLTPDGALAYSTFIGGGDNDRANAIAVDRFGNAFITGLGGLGYPATPGAYRTWCCGAFVTKLDPAGGSVVYSTFLGSGEGYGITVDYWQTAYVTGLAYPSFPATSWGFERQHKGVADAFVTRLSADGSWVYVSTLLGGSGLDRGYGVAIDGSNNIYVAGVTYSADFPVTAGALQGSFGGDADGFVTKLNAGASALYYSTYLGGTGRDEARALAVHSPTQRAFVAGLAGSGGFPVTPGAWQTSPPPSGSAGFVTALESNGGSAYYSTLIRGVVDYLVPRYGLFVDGSGQAHLAATAGATGFMTTANAAQPASAGGYDACVVKLTSDGSNALYSTYLGGSADDHGRAVMVDPAGLIHVAGLTYSPNFPTTSGALQASSQGTGDAFAVKMDAGGSVCGYDVSPTSAFQAAAGGEGSVSVTTSTGCVWTANTSTSWISIDSGGSGTGSGVVRYSVQPNDRAYSRIGSLGVAGTPVIVNQASAQCSYAISPGGASFPAAGGVATVTLTTASACPWAAVPDASWIHVSKSTGGGSASLQVTVDPLSSGAMRSGLVMIGDAVLPMTQEGTTSAPMSLAVTPSAGAGSRQSFQFRSKDLDGAGDIAFVQMNFSGLLSYSNACHIHYNAGLNRFYLLNTEGTSYTAVEPSGFVSNGQCAVYGAGSSSSISDNELLTTVEVSFRAGFAGSQNVFLYTGDYSGGSSGWRQVGAWTAEGDSDLVEIADWSPDAGTGTSQLFTATFTDGNGGWDVLYGEISINTTRSGINACSVQHNPTTNAFLLLNDNATLYSTAYGGTETTLENSQCILKLRNSGRTISGTDVVVTFDLEFKPSFAGVKEVYIRCNDKSSHYLPFQKVGTWTVP